MNSFIILIKNPNINNPKYMWPNNRYYKIHEVKIDRTGRITLKNLK